MVTSKVKIRENNVNKLISKPFPNVIGTLIVDDLLKQQ